MAVVAQTKFSHKLFEPTLTINEAKTHCVAIFDKLKFQREQGRFCDVILKVYDRDFPAHRCVLASCSPWFDTKFKVHKTLKEVIEIENCKNYEVFHLVLTYMYSGEVVINKDNVADILAISHMYSINKLKSYCAEFLEKNIKVSNCLNAIELAEKYHLIDFSKQTLVYIIKHFDAIIQYHEIEKKPVSEMQQFIVKSWGLPNQLVLRIITRWVEQQQEREEHFHSLLNNLSWSSIDPAFIEDHLDKEKLYKNSEDALLTILSVIEKNNVELSQKYRVISQEKLLYESGLPQELDDSTNDLLFKDLENSDMYESISSIMQNMQNDSMGNEAGYGGPYRHPSGNDIDAFKAETEVANASQDIVQQQVKKSLKRSATCFRDDEIPEEDGGKGEQEELRNDDNKIQQNIDQSCSLLQDPRLYLGDIRSNESTVNPDGQQGMPGLPHPDDQLTSPPDGETNLDPAISTVDIKSQSDTMPPSYTNQESCNNMFKQFPTSSSQIVTSTSVMDGNEPCYRQAQYQNKIQPQFTNPDLRFHAAMVDHVDGELFKQTPDLYRDDLRVGGSGYSQLGFLPPGAPDQMLFQDHQVFARDQLNTNNSRDICAPHSSFIENYKQMLSSEQQNMMVSARVGGLPEEYSAGSYTKDTNDPSRNLATTTSSLEPQKAERLERMNSNRSNFDIDYSQLVDILYERPQQGAPGIDHVVNDQRLADRSGVGGTMDQVMNDPRLSDRSAAPTTKRYDPKFRALAEASKLVVDAEQALFGYKGAEADVVGDNLSAADYKSHFMYKLPSQQDPGSNYRGHQTTGYKQTDFIMGRSEIDCYRYNDMNRDCDDFKASDNLASYEKEINDATTRAQTMTRSTEAEIFNKSRSIVSNEYLPCSDMQKDNISFGSLNQESYHQSQSCSELRNGKLDRSLQLANCAVPSNELHNHVIPENCHSKRTLLEQKQGEAWRDGAILGLGDQQILQQEFRNCRISDRHAANASSRHDGVNTSMAANIPSSTQNNDYNLQHRHDLRLGDERQWIESRKSCSSWDHQGNAAIRSMSRHDYGRTINSAANNKVHHDDVTHQTNPSEQFLAHKLDFTVTRDDTYSDIVDAKVAEDQKLEDQQQPPQQLNQRKTRHNNVEKDSPMLDQMQIDCQFVEDMRPISYDPQPMSCNTPHYSRDSGSIIEPFRNSEILEPSLLELQDMNSFPSDMKKAILETPPRKDLESPSRRRQKTVPPPLVLTPKEKYAKEIHAERKLDSINIMKNMFNDQVLENEEIGKGRASSSDKPNEGVDISTDALTQTSVNDKQSIMTKDDDEMLTKPDIHDHAKSSESNETVFDKGNDVVSEACDNEVASSPRSLTDASDICTEDEPKQHLIPQHSIKIQNNILRIIRHKKKLASQKKLILEHGGVKLTHKQKIKLRQRKKKIVSKENRSSIVATSCKDNSIKTDNAKRKIVNLKDKLLAEHRSQNVILPTQNIGDGESPTTRGGENIIIKRPPCSSGTTTTQPPSTQVQLQNQTGSCTLEMKLPFSFPPGVNNLDIRNSSSGENSDISHPCPEENSTVMRQPCPVEKNVEIRLPCPEDAISKEQLEVKTINMNDLASQPDLKCLYCDVVVNQRKDYFKHLKDEHLRVAPFKCPVCDHEYNRISLLLKHHKTHTSRYECATCHVIMKTHSELRSHAKIHKEVPSYICDICSKSFTTKNNLDQHQAVHSDEKKFKCNCGFSTKYSSHLTEHKRTHEGKVHRCTLEGCQYWTAKKTLLNAHMRMHTGEKKFVCKVCSKGFVEAGQLRRHEKIHTNDKKFVCDVENCNYSSTRKDKLKEHKGRIHNREPTPPPERKHRLSKLSSLNKYHIPSVQSDISEVVDEDDPGVGNTLAAPHNNLEECGDDTAALGGARHDPGGSETEAGGFGPNSGGSESTTGCSGSTAAGSGPGAVGSGSGAVGSEHNSVGSGPGVNKYYSVESGVHLTESQIPYVKEEFILGM